MCIKKTNEKNNNNTLMSFRGYFDQRNVAAEWRKSCIKVDTVFIFTQLKLNYHRASRREEKTGWIEGRVRGRSSTGTLSLSLSSKMLHFHIFLRRGGFFLLLPSQCFDNRPNRFFSFIAFGAYKDSYGVNTVAFCAVEFFQNL